MCIYLIGYDLRNSRKDYAGLIEALREYGQYWHNLDSTWLIGTTDTAGEIYDNLASHLDSDDRLLVIRVKAHAAWGGFSKEASEWLQNSLNAIANA